jgi:hypothetical protein
VNRKKKCARDLNSLGKANRLILDQPEYDPQPEELEQPKGLGTLTSDGYASGQANAWWYNTSGLIVKVHICTFESELY